MCFSHVWTISGHYYGRNLVKSTPKRPRCWNPSHMLVCPSYWYAWDSHDDDDYDDDEPSCRFNASKTQQRGWFSTLEWVKTSLATAPLAARRYATTIQTVNHGAFNSHWTLDTGNWTWCVQHTPPIWFVPSPPTRRGPGCVPPTPLSISNRDVVRQLANGRSRMLAPTHGTLCLHFLAQ